MARNGGQSRIGKVIGRSQKRDPVTGRWTKRDTQTGRFREVKVKSGAISKDR